MKCEEIFAALALLEKERGIPQDFMLEKIVQALVTAYKRDHEDVENVVVDVNGLPQGIWSQYPGLSADRTCARRFPQPAARRYCSVPASALPRKPFPPGESESPELT